MSNQLDQSQDLSTVPDEFPRPAPECCVDWKLETEKLNAPITLAQARNPYLTNTPEFQFKPWRFCPWCGRNRAEFEAYATMKANEIAEKFSTK